MDNNEGYPPIFYVLLIIGVIGVRFRFRFGRCWCSRGDVMDRYNWFSVIVFLVIVVVMMLLSAPGQAEGQCCYTPEPEPPIPTLGPAPCNSDTPWGCYEHRLYLPTIVQGAAPTSTPEPVIVTPTPTRTATPTATVTPVAAVTVTLVIVTVTP